MNDPEERFDPEDLEYTQFYPITTICGTTLLLMSTHAIVPLQLMFLCGLIMAWRWERSTMETGKRTK